MFQRDVVITGVGVLCPIGIGRHAVWRAIEEGRSGIRRFDRFDTSALPVRIGGEVLDFEPKRLVAQRKSLKVMARDAQLGVAGSVLACQDAGIISGTIDPQRFGVVLGADRICGAIENSEIPYRKCMIAGQFEFSRWRGRRSRQCSR